MKKNFNEYGELLLEDYENFAFGFTNVAVAFDGETEAQLDKNPLTGISTSLTFKEKSDVADGAEVVYTANGKDTEVKATFNYTEGSVKQITSVKALSGGHILTEAAVNLNGVCYETENFYKRLYDGSVAVHYCLNKWQGEGQWRTATPYELGAYSATVHWWEKSVFRIDSVSSWTTGAYYPLVIIEDKKRDKCYYFELQPEGSWFIEVYVCSGEHSRFLSIKGGVDERLGFYKKMNAGDEFISACAVYGVTDGGFEEAVRRLDKYKRKTSVAKNGCELVFNDFMNCNWAQENSARLEPLIDAAAKVGADVFCIDDGWAKAQGLWYADDAKFTGGLKTIFKRIADNGMKIGVWFEFETVPVSLAATLGDDIFLTRNGGLVAPNRPLANMRSEKLRNYLYERVDEMYKAGVRFIKNDHNNNAAVGTTIYGESPAEGLVENSRAFLSFIDELRVRHPDLTIENCGSGAMRSDSGTLGHFEIQSTSDQENYVYYTSILSGSLAFIQPEKAGIWAYPVPLYYDDLSLEHIPEDKLAEFKSGEQTAYNMVNAMSGAMYLSGKIDQADELNFKLIKEGIAVYKSIYEHIKSGYPIYPSGRKGMFYEGVYSLGIIDEAGDKAYLSVWNTSEDKASGDIDLTKYGFKNCRLIYPDGLKNFGYSYTGGKLTANFGCGKSARLLELTR